MRELKTSGTNEGNKKRNMKGTFDYNAEVFFKKKPPLGFYDVSADEKYNVEDPRFSTIIEQVECEKRFNNDDQLRK